MGRASAQDLKTGIMQRLLPALKAEDWTQDGPTPSIASPRVGGLCFAFSGPRGSSKTVSMSALRLDLQWSVTFAGLDQKACLSIHFHFLLRKMMIHVLLIWWLLGYHTVIHRLSM